MGDFMILIVNSTSFRNNTFRHNKNKNHFMLQQTRFSPNNKKKLYTTTKIAITLCSSVYNTTISHSSLFYNFIYPKNNPSAIILKT